MMEPPTPSIAEGANDEAGLHRLPDELLLRISNILSPRDVGSMRLVDKRLSNIGLSTIQDRHILYLDCSNASLKRFREICNFKRFASSIKRVIYFAELCSMLPETLKGSVYYNEKSWKPHWSEKAFLRATRAYGKCYAEQQGILRRSGIETALLEAVEKLPNLETVTFAGELDQKSNASLAFNWNSCWDEISADDNDGEEKEHDGNGGNTEQAHGESGERGEDDARSEVHEDSEADDKSEDQSQDVTPKARLLRSDRDLLPDLAWYWDCPSIIMKMIAHHAKLHPSTLLNLQFYKTPLVVLFNDIGGPRHDWLGFLRTNQNILQAAVAHVKRIDVSGGDSGYYLQFNGELEWEEDEIDEVLQNLVDDSWQPIFSAATNVQEIKVSDWGQGVPYAPDVDYLASTVLDCTFPLLRKLTVLAVINYRKLDSFHQQDAFKSLFHPGAHATQSLADFLIRHASTLESLEIECATGVDEDTRLPCADALHVLLDWVKAECLCLRKARLTEERRHSILDGLDRTPSEWREQGRNEVLNSPINRLAEALGVVAKEEDRPGRPKGMQTPPDFEFDFGPWLLDRPNGQN